MGVIGPGESDAGSIFHIRPRTSGLPGNYRFFRHFCAIGRNSRVETGVIKDAELNYVITFEIQPIISGLNRKLSLFRDV